MPTLTIAWHDYNLGENGFNIYRSETPMDINSMPAPIDSVGPNIGSYDDGTVVGGTSYYYRVGVIKNGGETISEESKQQAANFTLVTGDNDNKVRKFDLNGNEIWQFNKNISTVTGVAIDSDDYIYSGADGILKKIDPKGNEVWSVDTSAYTGKIAVDSNKNIVAVGYYQVRKYDPDGNELWLFDGHYGTVTDVAVDQYGNIFTASEGNDDTIRKIDPDGNEVWKIGHPSNAYAVAVGLDGHVYAGGRDNAVSKIAPDGSSRIWSYSNFTYYIYGVAVDVNNNVYGACRDNTIDKIDPDGNQVWKFTGHTQIVRRVAVDLNENVYTISGDNTLRKIDPDGNEVWKFTGYANPARDIAVLMSY